MPDSHQAAREAAALYGASLIESGMKIGLGSGRAASAAIRAIAERITAEKLAIEAIATSAPSRALAEELGIPLLPSSSICHLDLVIDGADESDTAMNVIKGGGGALVREKLVARASDRVVFLIEPNKLVGRLGAFPLPVAITPFLWLMTAQRLARRAGSFHLRLKEDQPYVTDDGLYIVDFETGPIDDAARLEYDLKAETGVVEVGLFVNICTRLVIGQEDGSVKIMDRNVQSRA